MKKLMSAFCATAEAAKITNAAQAIAAVTGFMGVVLLVGMAPRITRRRPDYRPIGDNIRRQRKERRRRGRAPANQSFVGVTQHLRLEIIRRDA
jgi:hypothetical protein